jgi:hypothetical protein
MQKNAALSRRITTINNRFPYIKDEIKDWLKQFENNPYVLPFQIERDVRTVLRSISEAYDNYINAKKGVKINVFESIDLLLKRRSTLFNEINNHNSQCRMSIFACSFNVKSWLLNNNELKTLTVIKKSNGYITDETIKHIYYEPFVIMFKDKIDSFLCEFNIQLLNIQENELNMSYKMSDSSSILFKCNLKDFVKHCMGIKDGQLTLKAGEVFNYLFTTNSEQQDRIVIEYFNSILMRSNYTIVHHKSLSVLCYEKRITTGPNSGVYYVEAKINHFRETIARYIFSNQSGVQLNTFVSIVDGITNWKSNDEFMENKVSEKFITEAPPRYHRPRR